MVLTQYFDLDIVKPPLNKLRLVNGDTANQFVITIKNNGASVTLDADLHKIIAVFTRADGEVYTQDASCGVTFTALGVVTIDLRPASFRTGRNKITLQIYKRESSSATEYPLLLTTQEHTFNARAAAIPEAGAPNAPSQLPMLEQIIHDAGEAVTNCNNATTAANAAAAAANSAASAANAAATDATNAANAAWIRVDACNNALANVSDAITAANNAASAANTAAAAANGAAEFAHEEGLWADEKAQDAAAAASAANTAAAAATAAAASAPLLLHVVSSTCNTDNEILSITFAESVSEIRNAIGIRPIEFAFDVTFTESGITTTNHYYMRSSGWGEIGVNKEVYMYSQNGYGSFCKLIIQALPNELDVEGSFA